MSKLFWNLRQIPEICQGRRIQRILCAVPLPDRLAEGFKLPQIHYF